MKAMPKRERANPPNRLSKADPGIPLRLLHYATKKQKWFDTFRAAGPRDIVCELLMQKYGPGGDFEMFKYK
jgi:hypothetical protein